MEGTITERVFQELDSILSGKRDGYKTYGEIGHDIQRLTYAAVYKYNKEHGLKNEELEKLFTGQKPTNVRKQISQNRPKAEKQ